ncbi:unnamed protein product [Sympodiomycopsis kandeliae]
MASVSAHAESSRAATQLRPISIKSNNVLSQSHGSATFSYGHESALSSVNGPMEVRIRDELTDRATLEIQFIPLDGVAGITSSSFSSALQAALSPILLLHLYPRSLVQLILQSTNHPTIGTIPPHMHSKLSKPLSQFRRKTIRPVRPHPDAEMGFSQRAALINAAMLGLMSAGVQAKATLCGVAVAVIPKEIAQGTRRGTSDDNDTDMEVDNDTNDQSSAVIVVDPSPLEESVAISTHVFGFAIFGSKVDTSKSSEDEKDDSEDTDSKAEAKLAFIQSNGEVDWQVYKRCLALARHAAKDVRRNIRRALEAGK